MRVSFGGEAGEVKRRAGSTSTNGSLDEPPRSERAASLQ